MDEILLEQLVSMLLWGDPAHDRPNWSRRSRLNGWFELIASNQLSSI